MAKKKEQPIYKNNVRINSIQGVNRLLQRVINKLIQGEITIEKAKAIGYLSNITLKGLEMELEERAINIDTSKEEEMAEDWTKAVIEIAERRRA